MTHHKVSYQFSSTRSCDNASIRNCHVVHPIVQNDSNVAFADTTRHCLPETIGVCFIKKKFVSVDDRYSFILQAD
jgi:hypothetical protein